MSQNYQVLDKKHGEESSGNLYSESVRFNDGPNWAWLLGLKEFWTAEINELNKQAGD